MKTEMEKRLAALSPEKRALLMVRLQQSPESRKAHDSIPRRLDGAPGIPSHAQRRLWFLQRQLPDNPAYTFVHGLSARIRGELDVAILQRAITEIFRRHEILRATFADDQGDPRMAIGPVAPMTLNLVDLSGLPTDAREAEVRRLFMHEGRTPFDLAQGPLARLSLLRLEEDQHILLSAVHHITADGWSTGIFLRELSELYDAFVTGAPSPLPDLPIQYSDYAHWQVARMSEGALDEHVAYWKEALAGAPSPLVLPSDHPHPHARSHRGDARTVRMPQELMTAVSALARLENASDFMVLLAAFGVLINRYLHQSDFVLGILDANRNRRELEGLIGMFSNTLGLRFDASGDPTFRAFIRRVRDASLSAVAHADVPFDVVVEALQPVRSLKFTPLVQILVSLRALTATSWASNTLTFELLDHPAGTAKFDLSVEMFPHPSGIDVTFIYNTDIFEIDTIDRMMRHFGCVLEAAARDPDQRLSQLPLIDESERTKLLYDWNRTEAPVPETCVHQVFESIARQLPDEVAVRFRDAELTYGELDLRSNQLAHYLRKRGVGAGVPVALFIERSLEMMVGLLGILKAGGVFVPIDPSLPAARVAFLLEDAAIGHVLTVDPLRPCLPGSHASAVRLDTDWSEIRSEPDGPVNAPVHPDHLAYIIYTSGSTGEPKGTLIPHKGLANRLLWDRAVLGLGKGDRVLQKMPLGFDMSFKETLLPLLSGALVVLAEPGGQRDPKYLTKLMVEEGITFVLFVPSLLRTFLQQEGVEECNATLRAIWCGGEALPADLARSSAARLSAVLYNGYGPTEASIGVAYHRYDPRDERPFVPIGRPISNARIHVLDRTLNPVPPLVPGQIYIAGTPLAHGYLNRPALTAERFLPDPFSTDGGRMYMTGDLACYLPDGDIKFLGRVDRQVKIRGNRVELEEVERALVRQLSVRQATVVVRDDPAGGQRLVAYVVPHQGQEVDADAMRGALASTLPGYMIPSALITLDALPLTPTGKINHDALPDLGADLPIDPAETNETPPGELEAKLLELWRQVLGVRPRIRDNFFDVGGHSLLLIKLQSLIEDSLGREIPVTALFEHPTISAQVAYLATSNPEAAQVGTEEQDGLARIRARASRQREAMERQEDTGRGRGRTPRDSSA